MLILILALVLASCGSSVGAGQVALITGHVYSWACGPAFQPSACNTVIPDLRLRFDGANSHNFYEVNTDTKGAYSLSVSAGTYVVDHEWSNTDSANRPIVMLAPPDYGPSKITVAPGDQVAADFALRAGSRP